MSEMLLMYDPERALRSSQINLLMVPKVEQKRSAKQHLAVMRLVVGTKFLEDQPKILTLTKVSSKHTLLVCQLLRVSLLYYYNSNHHFKRCL